MTKAPAQQANSIFSPVEAWGQPKDGRRKDNHLRHSNSSSMDKKDDKRETFSHLSARQKATLAAMQSANKTQHMPKPNNKKGAVDDQHMTGRPNSPMDFEGGWRPSTVGSSGTRPKSSDSQTATARGSFWSRFSQFSKKHPLEGDEETRMSQDNVSLKGNDAGKGRWKSFFVGEPSGEGSQKTGRISQWTLSSATSGKSFEGKSSLMIAGKDVVTRIIMSPKFDVFIGLIVVANSITMALESEVGKSAHVVLEIFDLAFLIVFTIELLLRAIALRWLLFRTLSDFLDILIVVAGWIQVILQSVGRADDDVLQSFQALKVFRALRALRMLRMFVFFDGLWLSVSSFFNALWPLLWTCIFIAIILLIMSQFSVHLLGTSEEFEGLCLDFGVGCKTAFELFGTTVRSMTTLFQIMTLDEWRAVVQPICDRNAWTYLFFYFHIGISSLALMNLVTAVVVENSMQRTLRNDEFQRIKKFQEAEEEKDEIRGLLDQIDIDHFEPRHLVRLKDTWRTLRLMLETMGLSSEEDMQKLACAVDVNGDGDVSIAELLDFCLLMRNLSVDAIRMAFFQIMAEGTDKWIALDAILQKESAWITNSAVVARLERSVQDCLHTGTTPELTPRNTVISPVTEPHSPNSEYAPVAMSKMKSGGTKTDAVRSMAIGAFSGTVLKRQKRFQTLQESKEIESKPKMVSVQGVGFPSCRAKNTREIASDNDVLQELRTLREEVQSQTLEVDKQSLDIDRLSRVINDDVIAKMGVPDRNSVATVNTSGEDGLPHHIPKRSASCDV